MEKLHVYLLTNQPCCKLLQLFRTSTPSTITALGGGGREKPKFSDPNVRLYTAYSRPTSFAPQTTVYASRRGGLHKHAQKTNLSR